MEYKEVETRQAPVELQENALDMVSGGDLEPITTREQRERGDRRQEELLELMAQQKG